jgi:uncharacterized protein
MASAAGQGLKIAVIGGGIAGLAAAWWLSRHHTVTLFERHARPGFVAHTLAVDGHRVDVPLRVFYPGYYPTLSQLYDELGVATEPVSYATTFTDTDGDTFFRWRNLRLGDTSLPYVLPQDLASARARRIVAGALRFNSRARRALSRGTLAGRTLGEFVAAEGLSGEYVQGLLLPALATIATCSVDDALAYPADVVAGYLAAGLARQSVRRAVHGADDAAARLVAGVARVVCEAGVTGVRQSESGVSVLREGGVQEVFDHAVLATQANQALALWQNPEPAEAQALAAIRYRPLTVLMHRDSAFMPRRRADWSPVNARVGPEHDRPESTIWLNAVQPALRQAAPLFQTVHPQRHPQDHLRIGEVRFERPLVDVASQRALATLQARRHQPGRRVWLCGSYASSGVPLLESATRSAREVATLLDAAARSAAVAWSAMPGGNASSASPALRVADSNR